ncbi:MULTISPECIES: TetR family transcriptional regulator [unclassified Gordonia (in: high G+C Gram-positive bacteria)]|uniref:TetR/AcrR family transcriptional regulator n=1 Tax=unclassified Gordonia (in: high G+C Gram-positive bacteria) TaxID=2657482 RepID=UPI0032D58A0D
MIEPRPGSRAEHKARTRAAIRAAALELISKQGYQATTVAQIAERAGVSHTTLFRYFDSKEQVLVTDDLGEARQRMLDAVPPGLSHFDLARRMLTDLFEVARDDPWASDPQRLHLLRTEPVLRMAYQLEADRVMLEAVEFIADYTGTPADALELRVFVAALSGVMMMIAEQAAEPDEATLAEFLAAVDLLEQGLPLVTR